MNLTPDLYDNKVTLYIDRSYSRCGECGKNADPYEKRHDTVWTVNGAERGCGETFTHVSSNYTNMEESITAMRPDLVLDYIF